MSFLDRIFGDKKEIPKESKISLKEAEVFLENKINKDFENFKEPIKREYENLKSLANIMQNQLKILEQATYPEKTYPFIISKSVGSRKSFISKMNFLVKKIQNPIGEDMNSILNFYDEADKLINATNVETMKEYAFLKILFEKEGKEILQSFRQIFEINKKLGDIVKDIKESNSKMIKAKENISEIIKLKEELKKDEADKLDRTLKSKEDEVKKVENELERLNDSNDWKKLLEMQKIKEELKANMQNKKSEFTKCMTDLETPLKKYKWSVENNKILDDYIQKSFDSILYEDTKGEILTSTLRDIKIKIIEGKMKLKDSDKFMIIIENVKENNVVGHIIEEYLRLSEELKKQEEKIALQEILKRKISLESEFIRLKKELEEAKNEKKRAEGKTKIMQENKEQKVKELEELLNNVYGKRILLEIN